MPEMTGKDRRALIEMVRGWRANHCDLRFMQWLATVHGLVDPFYIEDGEMARLMEEWFEAQGYEVERAAPAPGMSRLDRLDRIRRSILG